MRTAKLTILTFCLTSVANVAVAAGGDKSYASLALTRTEDVARTDGDKSERVVTIMNLSGAFGLGSGLVAGAKYFSYEEDYDSDLTTEIKGYGPMIGFLHQSGFYANFAYLLWPEKIIDADGDKATYSDGNGYVLDVGKVWDVGSSFGVGIALSKSSVSYEKVDAGNAEVDLDGEWSDESLYPYGSFFIYF